MVVAIAVGSAAALLAAALVKRARDRREMERHSITAEALHQLRTSDPDVLVVDVRLPLDLLAHSVIIPGAKRIAPREVQQNPRLLPNDRDVVVYCTCPSDETSRFILHKARSLGFARIKFLKGGLEAWKARGFPVEPYDQPFSLDTGDPARP
ncbi:MAG: rhodanese-like domain-containing protein [Acidobacteriaceae bacterium]